MLSLQPILRAFKSYSSFNGVFQHTFYTHIYKKTKEVKKISHTVYNKKA